MESTETGHRSHPSAIVELSRLLNQARRAVLRPPPRMSVPDWADTYRHLSAATGAIGGPWETHRVEVARGAMMAVTEPGVRKISAMVCTQTMKTELLMNTMGYFAHLDPAPMLLLQPKDEMADAFSKERLVPMIQSSPALAKIMGDSRTRNSDDTIKYKKFPGGFVVMAGAGSPTNLAMRAIRVVFLDEIDKYETTKEGDPILLAEERTSSFTTSSLSIRACSPTWEETSRIYRSFLEGDQRQPFVACPHCGHEQALDFFKHVHWEKGEGEHDHLPDTAAIYCESCGSAWTEAQRLVIMTTKHAVRWYQTKPFTCCGVRQDPIEDRRRLLTVDPDAAAPANFWDWDADLQVGYARCSECGSHPVPNWHASFTASKLYNPFANVVDLVRKWLDARLDPESKQTFINTQLGRPYKADAQKAVASHWLASRAEQYEHEVPDGVLVITAGIDVQDNRLEAEVVGWGLHEESWSLKTEVFEGDPAQPGVWAELDAFLLTPLKDRLGRPRIIMGACIDSGGHHTQEVYRFAQARIGRNVWATKGSSDAQGQWSPVWPAPNQSKKHHKYRVGWRPIMIGVNSGKEAVRQRLLIESPGPGYCHFPVGRPSGWYDQLTSEQLVIVERNRRKWTLKKGLANEALDCRVLAYAALQGLYVVRKVVLAQVAALLSSTAPPPPSAVRSRMVDGRRRVRSRGLGDA